jgi:hypothetical protein
VSEGCEVPTELPGKFLLYRSIDKNIRVVLTLGMSCLLIYWGFAKKGYTPLFLRQKGAHQKNVWKIYNKHSMISHCALFWRKNTGEYPPVSIQLNKYPFLAVEITGNYPFLANARDYFSESSTSRQHDSKAI